VLLAMLQESYIMNENKIIISLLFIFVFLVFISCSPLFIGKSSSDINVNKAARLITKNIGNNDFVILDVRTNGEFTKGHLEKAIHINYFSSDFSQELSNLTKNKIYLVYCKSGGRSASAVNKMLALDFTDVYNLVGGIDAWLKSGYKIVN
jgi:rhodanese-related sulfurtransferase